MNNLEIIGKTYIIIASTMQLKDAKFCDVRAEEIELQDNVVLCLGGLRYIIYLTTQPNPPNLLSNPSPNPIFSKAQFATESCAQIWTEVQEATIFLSRMHQFNPPPLVSFNNALFHSITLNFAPMNTQECNELNQTQFFT